MFGYLFGINESSDLGEKRNLSEPPRIALNNLKSLPDEFDAYYIDRFGFRNPLIKGHNYIKYKLLKGSSIGKVLIGENGWLYLTENETIADFLGHKQLMHDELNQWKLSLEASREFLSQKGCRLLFVIAPNKSTIYPEYLPEHIRGSQGRMRMDQLLEYLSKNSPIDFIDLRPVLLEAKKQGLVYHPHDTHWNYMGGFIAYNEICTRLNRWYEELKPKLIEDFSIKEEIFAGDLSIMLGLSNKLAEKTNLLIPKQSPRSEVVNLVLPDDYSWPRNVKPDRQIAMENPDAKLKCVLFHDSFGSNGGFRKYLAEHFKKIAFVPAYPDLECLKLLVEQEKPDLVIIEIVERKLGEPPAIN